MMQRRQKMGYWTAYPGSQGAMSECEQYKAPMTETQKKAVLAYMSRSYRGPGYMGFASCRICGERLGTCDMTTPDGKWMFPEKWEHYIIEHGLRPTTIQFVIDAQNWVESQT